MIEQIFARVLASGMDTASNVDWEEEEDVVQADTQATKHVEQCWINVPAGILRRSKISLHPLPLFQHFKVCPDEL